MSSATDLIRTFVIDFDGTIAPEDVSEALLDAFAPKPWWDIDMEFQRGEIGSRECLVRQGELFEATQDELLRHALANHTLDPTFRPFVRWAQRRAIEVIVATDGFGFYVEPMLRAAGVDGVRVLANASDIDAQRFDFPNAHPTCVTCGTCKMNVVTGAAGPVAFVGEGHTDRYGALYADVVFAKKHLVEMCRADGVPYLRWETFDDVRGQLEQLNALPGPVAPARCPGWTEPQSTETDRVLPSQLP